MELGTLAEAIDGLQDATPDELSDPETVLGLYRQLSRLEALVAGAAAAFDTSREWSVDGARSAGGWLAVKTHLARSQVDGHLLLGRAVRDLPHTKDAFRSGSIGACHVRVLSGLRNERTEQLLARDEEMLVGHARTLRFGQFCRAAAYWKMRADPDGTEEDDDSRRDRRDVYLVESFQGMYLGRITLDPINGAIVHAELERRERALFEEDWAEAKERLGRDPAHHELRRTSAQLCADALVEMAIRSSSADAAGRRPAPLFSVLVGYESLHGAICELASGQVLSPRTLLPWLSEAYFERVVFAPGARVEVSETARVFTGATRRAIELRDRECYHPLCDVTARRCQVDHIVPFAVGGLTTQENGRLACGFHNRARNPRPPPMPDG